MFGEERWWDECLHVDFPILTLHIGLASVGESAHHLRSLPRLESTRGAGQWGQLAQHICCSYTAVREAGKQQVWLTQQWLLQAPDCACSPPAGRTRRTAKASKGSISSKQRASEVQQIINKTAPAFGRGAAARFLSLAPERGPADS